MNHASGFDAGQTHVESLIRNGKSLVVYSQQVQQCGVQITDVDRIFCGVITQLIRVAI